MKTLPNGVTVFNATPHVIRFWREDWQEPVEVEPDATVSAKPVETEVRNINGVSFVKTVFEPVFDKAYAVAVVANDNGAIVVGSIIAAQAFPGVVVAMTPAPGFERVPPDQKRMNPDKFTVF
jgi:hypothetical protein